MALEIFQVDAFTDQPFTGNPAAVCILNEVRDASWMQKVAREMNLPETAFLSRQEDGFDLRWFTPSVEVDLCGHATLASAHILWETGQLDRQAKARFHTRSGLLTAEFNQGEVELDFPATPDEEVNAPDGLYKSLGVVPVHVGKSVYDYLVEVDSEKTVRDLRPDLGLLKKLDARGTIVTARANGPDIDFVSRFFAPGAGIDEDPVTGSAHCCLGPYWGNRLGKKEFVAFQASERGGTLRVRLSGDRVILGGRAVTVLRGLLVDA